MTMTKNKMIAFLITGVLLLSGCGKKEPASSPSTPLEIAECTMECLKNLDMDAFNQYTDNYVQTYHNWIGIPVENEYRVFNELLQPRSKHSKKYQSAYKLDQKLMEQLTWEIADVRESGNAAEIDMIITNIDMSQVMETYTTRILENMIESPGIGLTQFIKNMAELTETKDTLFSIIDALDSSDLSVIPVTVSAYQDNGQWKIHLTHDFINAFSGNMYTEDYDEDSEQHLAGLEEQIERKAKQWAENIANRIAE